jgi:hypothetical protein
MAKYAFGIYGDPSFKYGQSDADRLYYSSQITAWAYDYGVISLRWKAVTADPAAIALGETLTHWRLTKTFTGTPDNAYSGEVVESGTTGAYLTSYIDTASDLSTENREVTYTLWIFSTLNGWLNCGTSKVNTIIPNRTQRYFKNWLPAAWLNEVEGVGDATGEYEENEFTAVLDAYGFEYDKIKAQAELLYNSFDAYKIPSNLLKNKITDLGFIYEPALGDTYHRSLYKTGNFINSAKGTSAGITTYTTALTHWDSGISYGNNLFLDYNDSSFEESVGRWAATNGTLAVCTYADTLSTLGVGLTPPKPTLVNKDYPLRQVSLGVVTATGTSDITLRCPSASASAVLYGIPVQANARYVFKGFIRAITNNFTAVARIQWFDTAGTSISTSVAGPTVTGTTAAGWLEFKSPSSGVEDGIVAPSNAVYAKPTLVITPTAGSDKYVLDMLQFRKLPVSEITISGKLPAYLYEDPRLVKVNIKTDLENLIPNPGFDLGTTGWEPFNAELIQVTPAPTNSAIFGNSVAKITALSDGRVALVSDWIRVSPGAPHTFAIYASGAAKVAKARIEFSAPQTEEEQTTVLSDADGRHFNPEPYFIDGEPLTLTGSATRLSVEAVSAVATPDYGVPLCKVSIYVDDAVAGDVFYFDGAILAESTEIIDYFQGNGAPIPNDPNANYYYKSNDCFWERRNQVNLVSVSSLENSDKWTAASGTTLSISTSEFKYGTSSLSVSASGGGSASTVVKLPMGAALGGEDLVISTYVKGVAGLYSISTNGQAVGNFKITVPNVWTRIETQRIAVAGETQFTITVALSDAGSGTKVFFLDGIQAEYGRLSTPYIDPADAETSVLTNPSHELETISVANNLMIGSGKSYHAARYIQKNARLKSTLNSFMPAGSTWSIEPFSDLIGFPDVEDNLVPSGSFENSTFGWSGVSATLIRTIARGSIFDETLVQGAAYAKIKASSSGTFGATTDFISVIPGKGYYGSVAVRPENEDSYGTYTMTLKWYDLSQNFLREKIDTVVLNRGDRWAYLDIIAPGTKTVNLTGVSVASNVVTITTQGNHGFSIGEELFVSILESTYSPINGSITITAVTPNTFSYNETFANTALTEITGRASFANTSIGFAKIEVTCTPSVSGTGRVFHLDKVLFRR